MKVRYSERAPSAAALKSLYAHARWAKDRQVAGIRRMLANTDLFLCAWKGRELVAFARVSTDYTYRAVLWDVIVRQGHQGQGLGSALVKRLLGLRKLAKVGAFFLFTTDKQAFYRKLGFKPYPKNLMVRHRGAR